MRKQSGRGIQSQLPQWGLAAVNIHLSDRADAGEQGLDLNLVWYGGRHGHLSDLNLSGPGHDRHFRSRTGHGRVYLPRMRRSTAVGGPAQRSACEVIEDDASQHEKSRQGVTDERAPIDRSALWGEDVQDRDAHQEPSTEQR